MWGHKQSPYEVLGVGTKATRDEIRGAWRSLAKDHHPDRLGGEEAHMALINAAYDLLSDPKAREAYDKFEKPRCPICNGKGFVMMLRGFKHVKQKCRDCSVT